MNSPVSHARLLAGTARALAAALGLACLGLLNVGSSPPPAPHDAPACSDAIETGQQVPYDLDWLVVRCMDPKDGSLRECLYCPAGYTTTCALGCGALGASGAYCKRCDNLSNMTNCGAPAGQDVCP